MEIKRGMVFLTDAGKTLGSEQSGLRPAVVIQNNIGNAKSSTTIVAFVTSQNKQPLPTHVELRSEGFERKSQALLEQLRTVSKARLKKYICTLNAGDMKKIDEAVMISLALTERTKYNG